MPLSAPAIAILKKTGKLKDSFGLEFLGLRHGVPMSDMTLTAVLRRMGNADLTLHGFRPTFRDRAADWAAYLAKPPAQVLRAQLGDRVAAVA